MSALHTELDKIEDALKRGSHYIAEEVRIGIAKLRALIHQKEGTTPPEPEQPAEPVANAAASPVAAQGFGAVSPTAGTTGLNAPLVDTAPVAPAPTGKGKG